MARLHELAAGLRAAAGLAHPPEMNEETGTGTGKHPSLGKEGPRCSRSSC
jgi:hypothetical protein